MREEILRARHNLLTCQDSDRVDSVIRLLEQTYQRLESEVETSAKTAVELLVSFVYPMDGQMCDQEEFVGRVVLLFLVCF